MKSLMYGLLVLASANATAGDCEFRKDVDQAVSLEGVSTLTILAAAGSLDIKGQPGISEARVVATLCASSQDLADDIELSLETGRVGVRLPGWNSGIFSGRQYAYVDLELTVPDDIALDVKDSSGHMEIENVGPTSIRDSSGNIEVTDVAGDLVIEDSSGNIDVHDIEGNFEIPSDSSGNVSGRDITGSVRVVRDSSGDLRFKDVGGDVVVERDSSGSIRVAAVGGDFRVMRDGSGGISHSGVIGEVDIPEDD